MKLSSIGEIRTTLPRKKYKRHWVKSYRSVPYKRPDAKYLNGYSDPKTGDIWLIKGKATKGTEYHEEYHSIKRHPDYPREYRDYFNQEFEADRYAYEKTNCKRHVLGNLKTLYADVVMNTYKIGYSKNGTGEAYDVMKEEFDKTSPPESWKDDWKEFTKWYNKNWNGYRL